MRRIIGIAALAGLLLMGLLVASQGLAGIGHAVADAGWGIGLVVLVHVAQLTLSGAGWQALLAHRRMPPVGAFIRIRWVREATSSLLPMTQVGGEFVALRLLTLRGVPGGLAGASLVVDLTVEAASQIMFTMLALGLLLVTGQSARAVHWAVAGLLLATPAVAAFVVAQRQGLFKAVERVCAFIGERSGLLDPDAMQGLHDEIQGLYRQPRLLLRGFCLHLLSWLAGAVEVWVALWCIGSPVDLAQALVIEGLGQAVRSMAFAVPGAYGVQEGGYMLIAAAFGLTPATGLTLSLVKRVREVLLGVPALLDWHLLEGRRLLTAAPAAVRVTRDE